ncbi:hypothetical protein V8B97DRAFT_1864802 [Scleroderma yunnanense]
MPIIQPPSKVLVSGANGFLAMWVIRDLLEHGYSVRGTVRSANKGEHLKKYFVGYADRLEIVIVEDMTKEGAFDEAVRGVDAIAHTASPVNVDSFHSDDIIGPAVQGTIEMLKSAFKFNQSIKRVVFTSSGATILRESDTPIILTEKDWNIQCLEALKERGESASDNAKYRASKTLAEQAAWKFMQEHKHEIGWDLTVLNPTLVGLNQSYALAAHCMTQQPVLHEVTDPTSLNLTAGLFYGYVGDPMKSGKAGNEFLAKTGSAWIDVRDIAKAHRLSLEIQEAGNERIIIDAVDIANALDPPPKLSKPLPKGNPGAGSQYAHSFVFDNSKSKRILELKYRSMTETTKDTLKDYEARGW